MTTHERERLEGLAREWDAEAGDNYETSDRVANGYATGLDEAAAKLTSLLSEMGNGWILVEETEMPNDQSALFMRPDGEVSFGARDGRWVEDYRSGDEIHRDDIAHWQPLPGPPTQRSGS